MTQEWIFWGERDRGSPQSAQHELVPEPFGTAGMLPTLVHDSLPVMEAAVQTVTTLARQTVCILA